MTAYAGFANLQDYLVKRCRERGVSFNALSEAIDTTHSYVHGIANGVFSPSRKRLDAIAQYFDDNPKILRILANLELPPTEDEGLVGQIKEVAVSLSQSSRRDLLKYAQFLKSKEAE